ncbi:glycerol-3-phosphate 1-O-acyltransferase PlsY [Aestuariibius sp. HNIBRBA575]|uniref:glycerol-3-phosphate 1-O-acyltransferase PlsY n=1 Tax=Aestuariibius sp. HNIBRBA575 TaxID=3233343 RepID=UPI0034A1B763
MPEISSAMQILVFWAAFGYLLGSVPFGVLLARVFGLGNLRDIGSGNIGATNVLRTGNKKAAFLTLLFDGGKGAVAVLLARHFAGEDAVQLAGLMAFIGHCFPIWLRFKGGKGVATFFGILLAWAWPIGLIAGATWLLVAAITRYSSMSALLAAGFTPVYMFVLGFHYGFVFGIVLALLIYARHWANIQRLRAGTETKIGQK